MYVTNIKKNSLNNEMSLLKEKKNQNTGHLTAKKNLINVNGIHYF